MLFEKKNAVKHIVDFKQKRSDSPKIYLCMFPDMDFIFLLCRKLLIKIIIFGAYEYLTALVFKKMHISYVVL